MPSSGGNTDRPGVRRLLTAKETANNGNMSAEKAAGTSCNKFQPNIFNKNKCQNCFKSREVHLVTGGDTEQSKPVYAGWLCLAPMGTDFTNPMLRSRKWQRRFFILYEHGSLSYALDELLGTIPQGTVNLNLCTDITDAEPRTGQKNSLCVVTPAQEIIIRGDNKEIISGWNEQLAVCLRTNKQNQKKKRKVEPVANQEPSPAKMAATGQTRPSSEGGVSDSIQWQEEHRGPDVTPLWTVTGTDPPGPEWSPAGNTSSFLCSVTRGSLTSDGLFGGSASSPDSAAAGGSTRSNDQQAESTSIQTSAQNQSRDRSQKTSSELPLGSEVTRRDPRYGTGVCRSGRTEARPSKHENLQPRGDEGLLSAPLPHQRRSRSLDSRTSDTVMTPDLLNFKKGWMMKLDAAEQWRKFWFVLSTDRLRFYRDSVAEETSDLEGEIDLTKCFSVSEYQVQRNYSFQIHTLMGVFTLSAMTAGIRRNWIQALMKNVRPAITPDVASLPGHHIPCSPPEVVPRADVTQDSALQDVPTEKDPQSKSRSVTERWEEGCHRTFDWSEFRPQSTETDCQETRPPSHLELGDLERQRRREERRRKYESMLGFSLGRTETQKSEDVSARAQSQKSRLRVEEEIEECWRKVEKSGFVPERKVLLGAETQDRSEVEKLHSYRKMVEDLKAQLDDSERRRLKLEAQIGAVGSYDKQFLVSQKESREHCLQQQLMVPQMQEHLHLKSSSSAPQLPIIWLQDTEDSLQQLDSGGFSQQDVSQVDGSVLGLNFNGTSDHHLDREDHQLVPTSETSRDFLILEDTTHNATDPTTVNRLSQEVEELTRQNQALDQQNQEMINQLMEADREIERLKAELSSKFSESRLLPNLELKEKMIEDLERQLSLRNQELLDAQTLISSLLQLKAAAETQPSGNKSRESSETSEGCLRLTEMEKQLEESERTCRQLEQQNAELYLQRASEEESNLRRLKEENQEKEERNREITDEERIQQVMEGMVTRLRMLEKLLEVIDRSGLIHGIEEEESPDVVTQLRWEEEFWKLVLKGLKDEPIWVLLREVTEGLMLEKRVLLEAHDLLLHSSEDLDLVLNGATEPEPIEKPLSEMERLRVFTQIKIHLLNQTSSIRPSALLELLLAAGGLSSPVSLAHSAAAEALFCCRLTQLRSRCHRGLCCIGLQQEKHLSFGSKKSICCQMDEIHPRGLEAELQNSAGEMHEKESRNNGPPLSEEHLGEEEEEEESNMDVSDMGVKTTGLEDQLLMDWMKDEFQQKMNSVHKQHEEEAERLKATCERGLATMEECHLKAMEELQRLHQQEVERLLVERDQLLQEESAATATAIEAIQNAHREELQREVQRRCQSENGNLQLEEIHRQHREELVSSQRELDVLSQQFSLKCLEIGHLVQALDAERKALCQCQQENQDLRSRNQELSGHLAAEITRLCSTAKRAALPLSPGVDRYEMEITLRVKESEVHCLKQEITSLKDELQAALKDKRNANRKYKDALTELSVVRVKGEREADELRENLKLAHQALSPT